MRLPSFDLFEPRTIKDALAVMSEHKGLLKVLGGGTELLPLMKLRLLAPQYVMSTRRLGALTGIEEKKGEVLIGAGTSLREIAGSPLLGAHFNALVEGASMVAAYALQSQATIGGNLLQNTRCLYYNMSEIPRKGLPACYKAGGNVCNVVKGLKRCFSVYQGDIAPILISLGAKAQLKKQGGSRRIPLSELYTGNGKKPVAIEPDELLTQVSIPVPTGLYGSSYYKLRIRKALDFPLASAAAFISMKADRTVDTLRVVLGAAGPGPKILEEAGKSYKGKGIGEKEIEEISARALKAAEAIDNTALPGAYRRKMMKVVTARALKGALRDLEMEGQR